MDVLLIHPPATKPAEPPLGTAVLLGHLRRQGVEADAVDANLAAYLHLLDPGRLAAAAGERLPTSRRRAIGHAAESLERLRTAGAPESFARYGTAVRFLNEALTVWGRDGERVTLGDYVHPGLSEFSPRDLEEVASGRAPTLFAGYFGEVLVPAVVARRPRLVGLSVNYRHQVLPAFELAGMLRRALPGTRVVAGGGMFSSWRERLRASGLRFGCFDHVVSGPGERALAALARGEGAADWLLEDGAEVAFAPDYGFAPLGSYLSPEPVLPVSATRGCYWRRCLFCPEAAAPTHPYRCEEPGGFVELLLELSRRHGVRRFHVTDNAIPVKTLRELARRGQALEGIAWHGFVRFERALLEPGLAPGLARAGCRMLQLGLESGSQPVLDRLGKGTRLEDASAILRALEAAGIGAYVYVMLGTPGETEADAERTLEFLEAHASAIGFLNIAIMNLPRDSGLLAEPERHGIRAGRLDEAAPLGLYQPFAPENGWGRGEARRFLTRRLLGSARIREIVRRTPPLFTSNHAPFFVAPRAATDVGQVRRG
jgi:radical SAM superfamily enzyme YgiQ (UPF0313 family)